MFTDPDRVAVKALGPERAPGVRVHPRRRHRRGRRRGVDARRRGGPSPTPSPRRRRGARRTSRSSATPARSTGRRRSADACRARSRSPTCRSSRSSTTSCAALAGPGRAVVAAPPGAGKTTVVPLAAARRAVARRPAHRHARTAPPGDACRGPADGRPHRHDGRRPRRLPDPRRAPHRRRRRGSRSLTEGVLTRRLQQDPELPGVGLVIFDEVHERNLTTDLGLAFTLDAAATLRPDLRIAAMSATADTALFARLLATDGRAGAVVESAGRHVPRRRPLGARGRATTGWSRRDGERDPAGAARRGRRRAGVPARHRRDLPARRPARRRPRTGRRRPPPGRRAGAGGAGPGPGAVAARPAAGRAGDRHRRDVADRRGRARRRRQRAGPGAALRPGHRHDAADDGVDQPRLGRPAGRPGRAGRARRRPTGCGAAWSTAHARPTAPPRSPRSTSPGFVLELAAWGTPAEQLSFVDAPPAKARRQAVELLTDLGALDDAGAITAARPVDGRPAGPPAPGPHDRRPPRLAGVRRRRPRRGARRAARPHAIACRPTSPCASPSCAATCATTAPTGGPSTGSASGRPTSPGGPGCASTPTPSTPTTPARRCSSGSPTASPARRRPGQFQLRNGTGAWVADDDPLATAPRSSSPPTSTASASNARIRLGAAVDAGEIAALLAGVVEDRRLEWDDGADDLVERVERRLDALRLGEERRRPAPGEATTAALVARVRTTKLAVLPWTPATSQLRARMAFLRADVRRRVAGRVRRRPARHARRVAGAVPRRRHRPRRPRPPRPRRAAALDAAVAARCRPRRAGAADVDAADRAGGGDRLRRGAPDRVRAGAGRVRRAGSTRRSPAAACRSRCRCSPPPTARSRSRPTCPGFWTGSWAAVRKDLAGRYPKHRWPRGPRPRAPRPPQALTLIPIRVFACRSECRACERPAEHSCRETLRMRRHVLGCEQLG